MKKVIISAAVLAVTTLSFAFKYAESRKNVTIINTVEVKDYAEFKKGFDAGAPIREKGGIKVINLYQSVDNKNVVTIIEEAASAEAVKQFFSNPDMKAAMEKTGVISKPDMKILTKVQ